MAPEVISRGRIDNRSDIYSLGMTMYSVLNGGIDEQIQQIRMSGKKLPSIEGVAPEFMTIIQKMCAFRREDRYSSAQMVIDALETAEDKIARREQREAERIQAAKAREDEQKAKKIERIEIKQQRLNQQLDIVKSGEKPIKAKKPLNKRIAIGTAICLAAAIIGIGSGFIIGKTSAANTDNPSSVAISEDGKVDLRNRGITNVDAIIEEYKGKKVSFFDLSHNNISPAEYEKLQAAFPEAEINWDVLIGCNKYSAIYSESICIGGYNIENLKYLKNLVKLECSSLYNTTDISSLASLTNLQSLDLLECENITNISLLASLTNLQTLTLSRCKITDLSPLASLTNLHSLNLVFCKNITDISPLASLTNLQSLSLSFCENITNISPLASLTSLQTLSLAYCYKITNISPLASLTNLQNLYLHYCHRVTNIEPLMKLDNLEKLYSYGSGFSQNSIDRFKDAHPKCIICNTPQ